MCPSRAQSHGFSPKKRFDQGKHRDQVEPPVRIELTTFRLQGGSACIRAYSRVFAAAAKVQRGQGEYIRAHRGYPPVLSQCLPRLVTTT